MKNKKMYFLLVAMSNLSVTSCSPSSASEENKKQVTMVIEADQADTYKKWRDEFEQIYKEEGYTVKFTTVAGGQVTGKQDNLIAQNSAPDIIVGGDVHILSQYKYLLPLDELIARDDEEVDASDFIEAVYDQCKYNETTYYLPNFFNSSLLYYNKDLFDIYNGTHPNSSVDYPNSDWTYEHFLEVAKMLTVGNGNSYSQWGCYSTIGWWGEWLIHIRQNGGEIMDSNGLVTLNTAQATAGLQQYLNKMTGDDKCSYTIGQHDLGGFSGKMTAMLYGGHISEWSSYKTVSGLNWDVSLLPAVNGNRTGEFAVDALGIYKNSNAKEAAWAFIKFITKKRSGQELLDHPFVAVRKSMRDELLAIPYANRPAPKNLEAVYASINENKILPQFKYFRYVTTSYIQDQITLAVERELTAEQALTNATTNANKYIKANYM